MKDTVLVLGAGSSASYGFPTGNQLKNIILNDGNFSNNDLSNFNFTSYYQACIEEYESNNKQISVNDFKNAFKKSASYTIDTFLSSSKRTSQELDIGKYLISSIISFFENESRLVFSGNDNWIEYFFFKNISYNLESFIKNPPTIISFNYDTFFENKLLNHLENEHGLEKATEFVDLKLNIQHVYGRLLNKRYPKESYTTYQFEKNDNRLDGSRYEKRIKVDYSKILNNSQSIDYIRGTYDKDSEVKKLRDILLDSKKRFFLGFGFDRFNNQLLFKDKSFFNEINLNGFKFTNYGLEPSINEALLGNLKYQDYYEEIKCLELLKKEMPPELFP